jgi:ribosomal protein S18 acetylase RimI-like enzyme
MQRARCSIRDVHNDDRGMLVLLAEETLHPLAEGSGHGERYHTPELLTMLDRADVFVAEAEGEMAGFLAVETKADALTVRCICVSPGFEGRGVANQLVEWAEGLAVDRHLRRLTAFVPATDSPSLRLYRGHQFASSVVTDRPDMLALEKLLPTVEG